MKFNIYILFIYRGMGHIDGMINTNILKGSGRKRNKICIDDTLYSFKSRRNLISFKNIHLNGYHIKTTNENSNKYLYITSIILG
jgi:hypothetical protein